MIADIYAGIILSVLLGALIGAQREAKHQRENTNDFAGFRSFILVCLLGYLIGLLTFHVLKTELLLIFTVFTFFLFIIIAYKATVKLNKSKVSIAGEISSLITFLIGVFISLESYHISISLAVLTTLVLFLGTKLHNFAKKIRSEEIFATIKFAVISLVILPLLPNKDYSLLDIPIIGDIFLIQNTISIELLQQLNIFNPFYIWLMVVFISGIAYFGYILIRILGPNKGVQLTGFLGGFMSSTALTSSFAIESKRNKALSIPLCVGVLIACSTMFIRILFEVAIINTSLLASLIPSMLVMCIIGYLAAAYILKSTTIKKVDHIKLSSPFTLGPALSFAAFFVIILFTTKLFSLIFGNSGIYILAFVSGVADVDAITISLSNLTKDNSISNLTATIGICIAAFANTVFKGFIAYTIGTRTFSLPISLSFLLILFGGIITLLILGV